MPGYDLLENIRKAAQILRNARFTTVYTGAGISVESGIPPFRGENGIWQKYDPSSLELQRFISDPVSCWKTIKEIFYDFFDKASPNTAHLVISEMERRGLVKRVITQNIDNLHQQAGSTNVFEFHGNSRHLVCLGCSSHYPVREINLDHLPPTCRMCGGILKPNFTFFGEGIPPLALGAAYEAASVSDVFLIIGTTGEVLPANQIPVLAKQNGAVIIEVNPERSAYTNGITDIFLSGKATEMMKLLAAELFTTPLQNDQDGVN